jgi:putative transposase
MTLPRSQYVQDGQEGVYHCFNRCVRRAFLCGTDSLTGRDFSHRKEWVVDRLHFLASVFAIDVFAFAILANHFHTILHTLPNLVDGWSDREVATRWLTLCPKRHRNKPNSPSPLQQDIRALVNSPRRIATLRLRLSSISWFMAQLDEFIARAANKEDGVKGRFWESRFKCQALLDEAAICACMVYVDLNPIRADLAATPENSDFTSIQQRIRAWKDASVQSQPNAKQPTDPSLHPGSAADDPIPSATPQPSSVVSPGSKSWLCPISSDSMNRGILSMTTAEYFDLVDRSGRMARSGKRGFMDPDLAPILLRIGVKPDAWFETMSRFGSIFHLAAGLVSNLRSFADRIGRKWLTGVSAARTAFVSSPAQIT